MEPPVVTSKFPYSRVVWILMMNADLNVKPWTSLPRLLMNHCETEVDWEKFLR